MNPLEKLVYTLRHYRQEDMLDLMVWLDETPHCGSEVYAALCESFRQKWPLGYSAHFGENCGRDNWLPHP